MNVEIIPHKSKTWGVILLPGSTTDFHTGYEHEWENLPNKYDLRKTHGSPSDNMKLGFNAIICDEGFQITGMSRGRSAANFEGNFIDSDVTYTLGMKGTLAIIQKLQDFKLSIYGGFIYGDWTFAKQGQSIFLEPL